ncbi:MAG: signal peptidase I [Defluviitaleaceae bacterium]|nr:signal peptidase I [Defluviitaleaceae bacterium]
MGKVIISPVVYAGDFGHGMRCAILPIGVDAELDTDRQCMAFLEMFSSLLFVGNRGSRPYDIALQYGAWPGSPQPYFLLLPWLHVFVIMNKDVGKYGGDMEEQMEEQQKKGAGKEALSWIIMLGLAVAAALLIRNFVIVNAVVPTGSMRPTIAEQDRLVAWRLSYVFGEPQRYDVVIFRFPDDESILYVKRIIGMPGETVDIIDGQVFIDGSSEPLNDEFLLGPAVGSDQTFHVPEGSFFVLGDNRNDSHDSRTWRNTFLPRDNILGRAAFVYWPRLGIIR